MELTGKESYDIGGLSGGLKPGLTVRASSEEEKNTFQLLWRIDTANESEYYRHGGILHFVLRSLLESSE